MRRDIDQWPRPSRDKKTHGKRDEVTTCRADKETKTSKSSVYQLWPKLAHYSFCVNMIELVAALKDMRDKLRWPKEMRTDPSKNSQEFWYEFHNDHGHKTYECRLLQREVDCLLKQEYLTNFSLKSQSCLI